MPEHSGSVLDAGKLLDSLFSRSRDSLLPVAFARVAGAGFVDEFLEEVERGGGFWRCFCGSGLHFGG